ncbi:MAG: Gfo/Idh/MocA family protein, partial [Actinomycetes bacterium]
MTYPPRAGIIGTGFMGAVHSRAVRAAGSTVSAVAGSSQASAEAAAAGLGAQSAAGSPEALIARDEVDVVHICTPNATHAHLARKAIAAGKAVICEKPLATTVEDARDLTDLAEQAGLVAAVPFVYRFYPAVREARDRIRSGEAGRLWLLHGSYLQDWLAGAEATNWRVDSKIGGASRAFGDIGVHWCDLMEFTTGHRITRIMARTSRAYEQRETSETLSSVTTEDGAVLLFETDQGATGSLVVSQVSPGRKNRLWFSFDGTEASFSFNQERPDTLHIGRTDSSSTIPVGPQTLTTPGGRRY